MTPFRLLLLTALSLLSIPTLRADGPPEFIPVDTAKLLGSPDPLPLEAEVAFPGLTFDRPVELTHPGDGSNRLFVVEQKGVIRVFENQPDVRESQLFLDLEQKVSREGNEEGLLGLAFAPDFKKSGEFYIYYSVSKPRRASVISRLRVSADNPNQADPDSERKLMEIPQPFNNHNGGSMVFGKDGYLYIGLGDGGLSHDPYGNGQDLSTLPGSILRIDVSAKEAPLGYAIPADNPFVNRPGAQGEIYAFGFRNPWRLSVDRETGALWCGDVGQERYEEVNLVLKGGNYGWKPREGKHAFDNNAAQGPGTMVDPVAEYFHGEGQSITGGLVYRGERLPDYAGRYFFADYLSGFVWTVHQEGDGWKMHKVADTKLEIAAFGADAAGEMYLCAFNGKIHRLKPRDLDLAAQKAAFPKTLTETGLFASVKDHQIAAGVLPYGVNIPFWSDGAEKDRFIALPGNGSIQFSENEDWLFPQGTVFIKTFRLPLDQSDPASPGNFKRLETRLFVHGRDGWAGYTYKWNDEQTEATLLNEAVRETLPIQTAAGRETQTWHYPSRVECMACHTPAKQFVLGWETRQLNREQEYPGHGTANQIDFYAKLGLFQGEAPPTAEKLESYPAFDTAKPVPVADLSEAELERHSRAWLDVNCSMCHHPKGIAGKVAGATIDLRFHTPPAELGVLGREPGQGHLSPEASAVLAPGQPDRSELIHRISNRNERQMPPLATLRTDREAIQLLRAWLESPGKKPGTEAKVSGP